MMARGRCRLAKLGGSFLLAAVGIAGALEGSAGASTDAIIHVPGDQPTIQAGIDAASDGDTVAVDPGTYFENLDLKGKAITVISTGGARSTIVDGGSIAPVITMDSGEGPNTVIQGFTLQHGRDTFESSYGGGGIYVTSSPRIIGNIITRNAASGEGAGIAVFYGSPLISGNHISWNHQSGGSGGNGGGGISVSGNLSRARIVNNTIDHNAWKSNAGGISLNDAGEVFIANNVIKDNFAAGQGGGIWMVNDSDPTIVQNLIVGNTAGQGGGVYWSIAFGIKGPTLVNNTIAGNFSRDGSGIWGGGFQSQVELYNNVVVGINGESAVYCDGTYEPLPPLFQSNDAWSPNAPGYEGSCAGVVGSQGNISADPMFVGPTNYHLQVGSPCVDAGDNGAPSLPPTDIDGDPRILGAAVDQGYDEVIAARPDEDHHRAPAEQPDP